MAALLFTLPDARRGSGRRDGALYPCVIASFVDVLSEDYMRTARAKGVSETWVVLKHGLRNAMIPVVTMMGLQFGFLLGGSIVVEKVFNWPGLGRLLVDSVEMRDYPVIQAEILLFSLEFILINLVVERRHKPGYQVQVRMRLFNWRRQAV